MKAFLRRAATYPAAALLAGLAVVALAAWGLIARGEREMRSVLLQETQMVAQMVDVAELQSLTGTAADTSSPTYLGLKKRLGEIRSANPLCRFAYLVGRNADGEVFFFVDDQPVGGKDEAPAGTIYNDAPEGFRQAFDSGLPMIAGPYTDKWGTFFSGVVPITDPATGAVLAALGMDIDANAWKRDVAAKVALPVGLLLVLLIIAATAWASARRVDASPKPVMWRLLPPLVVMVILMLAGAGAIVYQQQKHQLDREIAANISDVAGDLSVTLKQQATGLAATAQTIAADPTAQMALREGDADRLLATWGPVFETLKQESPLTHFYFFDKNRVCLLRVHKPEKRGDRIERFTAIESERTGETASGIELGPLGTFTLRVVQPVFADGQLVGYVELGKEIEEALQTLNAISGDQLAVVIRKDQLNRPTWEDGMRLLGRDAAWDRMPRHVVIYASQGRMPDAFAAWADQMPGEPSFLDADRMISFDGKDWRVAAAPLKDVSGKDVGALLIMRDATAANAAIAGLLSLSAAAGMGLLALLVGFIYVLLRRTDAGILAQQSLLQESEARMRAITDSAQDAILMMDPEGKVAYWNPAAERIFGHTVAEATGQDLHALIAHSRYHEARRAAFPAFLATGKGAAIGRTLDLTAIRKDGQEIEVQLSLSALQLGGRWHSVGIVRDITESKRNEEKLLGLSVAVEQNPASIVITNLAGEIEYVNPKFCEVTGYTREEALGRNPRILKSGELPRERYRELWETILAGETWRGEFHNKRKSGELYWELASISPIRDTAGHVTHFVAVKEDITRRKQAEEELLESNLQLKETTARANELAAEATLANAAKSEFLANMSHEIRAPMNGVIGMAGMLLNSGLTDKQRRYAEIVHRSGESLLLLIADVLDHSKIEAGKLELEAADFDLDGVLDDISGVMALGARKKGLGFHCSADADVLATLRGDPGRLRQVLLNLVGNAIKFTAHGGVTVRASLVPATGSSIVVRFAVRDTGIGIPADKQERMFEKFTQADASTTRQYGGTGLGLAISKQLTHLMGGEIGVTSTVGEGSEFWFTASFAPPEGPITPRQRAALQNVETFAPARILVVEDNITNQQMTVIFLERLGLIADVVTNGTEAVRAVQTTPYDLVLMDVNMPEMDGLEATKEIRKAESEKRKAEIQNSESKIQNPKSETAPPSSFILHPSSFSSRLPIIALTGLALKGDREKCLAAGMDDYLTKPIKFEALAATLKKWLPLAEPLEAAGLTREWASPSPEGATSLPLAVFDRATLMDRLQSNEKLARRVIDGFLGDLPVQLERLKAHAAAGDARQVELQAHQIKGACATAGGDALCALAAALEQSGRDGDLAGIAARMPEIDAQFAALKAAMQEALPAAI